MLSILAYMGPALVTKYYLIPYLVSVFIIRALHTECLP